jgi:transposase
MSKRMFSEDQIKELLSNPNISCCSDKSITYSKDFKVLAVKKYYDDGYSPNMIFKEAGINRNIIGQKAPGHCLQRWRTTYKTKGEGVLKLETRGKHNGGGRPKIKDLTESDRIKRMEIEIAYLKAENDFLAKLRAAKKR